jgi:hypothetical protein
MTLNQGSSTRIQGHRIFFSGLVCYVLCKFSAFFGSSITDNDTRLGTYLKEEMESV